MAKLLCATSLARPTQMLPQHELAKKSRALEAKCNELQRKLFVSTGGALPDASRGDAGDDATAAGGEHAASRRRDFVTSSRREHTAVTS